MATSTQATNWKANSKLSLFLSMARRHAMAAAERPQWSQRSQWPQASPKFAQRFAGKLGAVDRPASRTACRARLDKHISYEPRRAQSGGVANRQATIVACRASLTTSSTCRATSGGATSGRRCFSGRRPEGAHRCPQAEGAHSAAGGRRQAQEGETPLLLGAPTLDHNGGSLFFIERTRRSSCAIQIQVQILMAADWAPRALDAVQGRAAAQRASSAQWTARPKTLAGH